MSDIQRYHNREQYHPKRILVSRQLRAAAKVFEGLFEHDPRAPMKVMRDHCELMATLLAPVNHLIESVLSENTESVSDSHTEAQEFYHTSDK